MPKYILVESSAQSPVSCPAEKIVTENSSLTFDDEAFKLPTDTVLVDPGLVPPVQPQVDDLKTNSALMVMMLTNLTFY